MTDRRLTIDCLQQATAETGTQFFDPSSLVAEAGVRVALYERGEDPFHYADDFRVRIGEAILTKMYGSNAALAEPSQARTAAAAMNPALAALHRGRVAQLGIDGSGLFAYYQTRLDQGRVIGEPDIDVAEIATRFLPRFAGYHVLRAGLGEIAFLLADMGLDTVAFDSDRARHLALQAGAHAMRKLRRWPSGRLDVVRQAFPPKAERETLCIATQGPLPVPEDQEDAVLDTIAGYGAVLFAPRLLLRVRETEAEQETLIEKLRVRGLAWIRDYRPYRAVLCARRDPYASR